MRSGGRDLLWETYNEQSPHGLNMFEHRSKNTGSSKGGVNVESWWVDCKYVKQHGWGSMLTQIVRTICVCGTITEKMKPSVVMIATFDSSAGWHHKASARHVWLSTYEPDIQFILPA